MTVLTPQLVALVAVIGGVVTPPVVSLLKRSGWSAQLKQLIAAVVSFAVALVALYVSDRAVFGLGYASLGSIVFLASQLAYAGFRGSALDRTLTALPRSKRKSPQYATTTPHDIDDSSSPRAQ